MNTPATPREEPPIQNADPTLAELKQELSDADLQAKGLLFAAKYLLCRAIIENGYDSNKEIPFTEIEQRLRQLFPMQEEEWLPNYQQLHSNAFRTGFNWARRRAYEEWRVKRVKDIIRQEDPTAPDADLEKRARLRLEGAGIMRELGRDMARAVEDLLGITTK